MNKFTDNEDILKIYEYRRLSERIVTGGQPSEAQLAALAEMGCQVVINLGMHEAEYALPDERTWVTSLGLEYIHIPVVWENPTMADLQRFAQAMQAHQHENLFVHCAANMRASVFMALYRTLWLNWPADKALQGIDLNEFPQVWQGLVQDALRT